MKFLVLLTTLLLPFYATAETAEDVPEVKAEDTTWYPGPLITQGLWAGGIYATTLSACRFFSGPFAVQRDSCGNVATVVASSTIVISSAAKRYRESYYPTGPDGKVVVVEVEEHNEL